MHRPTVSVGHGECLLQECGTTHDECHTDLMLLQEVTAHKLSTATLAGTHGCVPRQLPGAAVRVVAIGQLHTLLAVKTLTRHDCADRLLCCTVQLQNQALLHTQQPCAVDFCWVSHLSVCGLCSRSVGLPH